MSALESVRPPAFATVASVTPVVALEMVLREASGIAPARARAIAAPAPAAAAAGCTGQTSPPPGGWVPLWQAMAVAPTRRVGIRASVPFMR